MSAEIIVITLGAVAKAEFITQVAAVASVAIIMTVGVYGFVAFIVKLDDMGLYLLRKQGQSAWLGLQHKLGKGLLLTAPMLMKSLAVLGTIAMFLVGGGILAHGLPLVHELTLNLGSGVVAGIANSMIKIILGILAGAVVLALVMVVSKLFPKAQLKSS